VLIGLGVRLKIGSEAWFKSPRAESSAVLSEQ